MKVLCPNFAQLTSLDEYQSLMAAPWRLLLQLCPLRGKHLHERGGRVLLISSSAALKNFSAMKALGKIGSSQDIARVIAFFLAPENWITGQVLAVDGGLSRVLLKNRQKL